MYEAFWEAKAIAVIHCIKDIEVKNPLAIIRVGLDYMTNRLPEQNKVDEKIFARMMRAIERADGIINGLLDFCAR